MTVRQTLADDLLIDESCAETDAVELRWVAGFYTYFGWFPWSDFEGERLCEEQLDELTAWKRRPAATRSIDGPHRYLKAHSGS